MPILVSAAGASLSAANTLDQSDAQAVQTLYMSGHQLMESVIQGARAPEANPVFAECRGQLVTQMSTVQGELDRLNILVNLAGNMIDKRDENWILSAIKITIDNASISILKIARSRANEIFAACSTDAFTVAKINEIFHFLDRADLLIQSIDRRIPASSR